VLALMHLLTHQLLSQCHLLPHHLVERLLLRVPLKTKVKTTDNKRHVSVYAARRQHLNRFVCSICNITPSLRKV
jgi:hypothetical protein